MAWERKVWIHLILCLTFFHPCIWGDPQTDSQKYYRAEGFHFQAKTGLNLIAFFTAPGATSVNRIAPLVGLRTQFFWNDSMGAYLGLEYLVRGAELNSGDEATADFLDLHLGFTWDLGNTFAGPDAPMRLYAGSFYAQPLDNLKNDQAIVQVSKGALGLYAELEQLVHVGKGWHFSFSFYAKVGLMDSFDPGLLGRLQKIIEIGMGIQFG